ASPSAESGLLGTRSEQLGLLCARTTCGATTNRITHRYRTKKLWCFMTLLHRRRQTHSVSLGRLMGVKNFVRVAGRTACGGGSFTACAAGRPQTEKFTNHSSEKVECKVVRNEIPNKL